MDFLQGLYCFLFLPLSISTNTLLPDYLPQAARFYNDYYEPYNSYVKPVYRTLLLTQSYFYRYIFPTLYPLYTMSNNALQSLSSDAPDLLTLGILAAVLIVSLKVLDSMRKTIVYWISMAMRLAMWAVVAGLGVYVWQRGAEQSVEDFGWMWGLLAGLGEEGKKVGGSKAAGRERDARRMSGSGPRRRTRGAGW